MIEYFVPATSANVGVGFDCLGLALNIYNRFVIEKNAKFEFVGFLDVEDKDNLFYIAYKETCDYFNSEIIPLSVSLTCEIPVSRGLGSSSSLIVGGIYAYYLINDVPINKEEIRRLATKIEGHPDNVSPCIYGGLCVCQKDVISRFNVCDKWKLYLLIPNYEVKTSQARKILKQEISISDAVNNVSSALIGLDGLINFDVDKVGLLNNDRIHEPYRKTLIKDYEECKKEAFKQGARAFLISGSGSTMLVISDKQININMENIDFKEVSVNNKGVLWQKNC